MVKKTLSLLNKAIFENVFYYENGFRIITRGKKVTMQNKIIKEKIGILVPIFGKLFPCTRSYSIEESIDSCEFNPNDLPENCVTRYIFFEEDYMRISLEIHSGVKTSYAIVCEVEYNLEESKLWNIIREKEAKLIKIVKPMIKKHSDLLNPYMFFKTITMENIMKPCPKKFMTMYNNRNLESKPILLMKLDGFRGRMYYSTVERKLYTNDDMHNVNIFNKIPTWIEKMPNVVFQIEVMKSTDGYHTNLVITDILGSIVNNVVYSVELIDVQNILKKSNINKMVFMLDEEKTFRLLTQAQLTEKCMYDLFPIKDMKIDGYIIISGQFQYKCKLPTVDLRACKDQRLYLDDEVEAVSNTVIDNCIVNCIYEVLVSYDGSIKILRKRNDRKFTSNRTQYDDAIKEAKWQQCNNVFSTFNQSVTSNDSPVDFGKLFMNMFG